MKNEKKCEGGCEEHRGEVKEVVVWGMGWKRMIFNYCEEAIAEDEKLGFNVEIRDTSTMTPKEKAKELVSDFRDKILSANTKYNQRIEHPIDLKFTTLASERCAIICVEEIIRVLDDDKRFLLDWEKEALDYWQQVLNHLKQKQ